MARRSARTLILLASLAAAACEPAPIADPPARAARLDLPHEPLRRADLPLHNLHRVADTVYTGSGPETPADFDALAALGVRTIISVDAAPTDVDAARARSMRYVHLPVGYDGISQQRSVELARAIRDLPGPVYVHCHHGKHRGPAAAAVALVLLGRLTPEQGVAFIHDAGTDARYRGLYRCVSTAAALSQADLDAADVSLPERAAVPGFTRAMTDLDAARTHLAHIAAANWRTPDDHPDLVPLREAAHLADLLRALIDDPVARDDPPMRSLMRVAADAAQHLEDAIAGHLDPAELAQRLARVDAACADCHIRHRD